MYLTLRAQAGRLRLLPVLLALGHSSFASGDIFKWTDANGVVQYSDRPPVNAETYSDISQDLPTLYEMDAQSLAPLERRTKGSAQSRPVSMERDSGAVLQQCRKYQQALARVQSQLRSGYDVARGNRLREQRRSLSEKIYRECRS